MAFHSGDERHYGDSVIVLVIDVSAYVTVCGVRLGVVCRVLSMWCFVVIQEHPVLGWLHDLRPWHQALLGWWGVPWATFGQFATQSQ